MKIFSHDGFKRYASNTVWLLIEKAIRLFFGLFVSVWLARYLGPEDFGTLNYAMSFVFLFKAFSTLGLDEVIVKEIVKRTTSLGEVLGTSLLLKSLGSVFIYYPLLILSCYLFNIEANSFEIILVFSTTVVFQILYIFDLYFQSQVKSKVSVFIFLISLIISKLLIAFFIYLNLSTIYFAYAMALEFLLGAGGLSIYYFFIHRNNYHTPFRFSKATAKELLKASWPLMLSGLLISLYMKIDQVMLGQMIDKKSVGEYAAALKFTEIWYSIPMILTASLFPAIINAKKDKGQEVYGIRVQRLMDALVFSSLAFAIFMSLSANFVIGLLYGEQYNEATSILKIHIWNGVFVSMGLVSGKWLVTEGLTTLTLRRSIIGCISNIILNYYLIPIYGGAGAAISTLISSSFSSLFADLTNHRTKEMFIIKLRSIFAYSLWNYHKKR
ncbi:MAG: O-unit flippase [Halobacteriovoraceae bacterium]|nr:O-unit flippase [Halobacteriovoraceae bacterium]|tara:strand:- start:52051 stop:53370 length:1320 start_codon:yes stop_codon:yes gene_type:complete